MASSTPSKHRDVQHEQSDRACKRRKLAVEVVEVEDDEHEVPAELAEAQRAVDEARREAEVAVDRVKAAKRSALYSQLAFEKATEDGKLRADRDAKRAAAVRQETEYLEQRMSLAQRWMDAQKAVGPLRRRKERCDRLWRLLRDFLHDGLAHETCLTKHASTYAFPCLGHDPSVTCLIESDCFEELTGCAGCFSPTIVAPRAAVWRFTSKGQPDSFRFLQFQVAQDPHRSHFACSLSSTTGGYSFTFERLCAACTDRVEATVAAKQNRLRRLLASLREALGGGPEYVVQFAATFLVAPSRPRCLLCGTAS